MKNLQILFTLLLGFHLLTDDISAQKFVPNTDSSTVVVADTSKIITNWDDDFIFDNRYDGCAPAKNLEDIGIKIFIPDSSLTDSMPILFPPPVDEGIFLNLPPYCGEFYGKQKPEDDDEENKEDK